MINMKLTIKKHLKIIKMFSVMISLLLIMPSYAGSINAAAYQTMRAQSYRNNYNRQVQNRVIPYWQAQANYSTRGRVYQNYANYSRYMNNAKYSNYGNQYYRGRSW